MAVNLLGASDARIDYGDIAGLAGATALTVSITFVASAIANDNRLASQWGSASGDQAFVVAVNDNDELVFAVSDGGGANLLARVTTDLDISLGGLYRCVLRWRPSPKTMEIWVNGVNRTVGVFVSLDGTPGSISNSTTAIQVGRETAEATDGVDGDYSEFAIHTAFMSDEYCIAYGKGYSPRFFRAGGLLHAPLINISNTADIWNGVAGANTSGTSAVHPPMIYPATPQTKRKTTPVVSYSTLTPDADISDGGWLTDTGGSSLFAAIDETDPSDSDYIISGGGTDPDVAEIGLSNPTGTPQAPLSVAYRFRRQGAGDVALQASLLQGSTTIATWAHLVDHDSFIEVEQFLTATEFAAISDFDDLRVELTAWRLDNTDLPADLFGTDLLAWYRADFGVYNDAGTTLATDGQTVQQWNDARGSGPNLSQGTGGNRPTFDTTGLNGLSAVVFDTTPDDWLSTAADALTVSGSAATMFFVGQMSSSAHVFGRPMSFSKDGQANDFDNNQSILITRDNNTEALRAAGNSSGVSIPATYSTSFRWCFVYENTTVSGYRDNVERIGTATGSGLSLTSGTLRLGAQPDGGANWAGPISEAMFVKRAVTAVERAIIEMYQTVKWGF